MLTAENATFKAQLTSVKTLGTQLCQAIQPIQDESQEDKAISPISIIIDTTSKPENDLAGEQQDVTLDEQLNNSQIVTGQTSNSDDQPSWYNPVLQHHTAVNQQYSHNFPWQNPQYYNSPYPPVPYPSSNYHQYNYQYGYPSPSMQYHGDMHSNQPVLQQQHQEVAQSPEERLSDTPVKDISTTAATPLKERPSDTQKDEVPTQAATQSEARHRAPDQLEARPPAADHQKVQPRAATQQEARSRVAANQQTERPQDAHSSSQPDHKHRRKTRRGCRGGQNKRLNCNVNKAGRARAANQKARPTVSYQKEARPRAAPRQNRQKVRQHDYDLQ